MGFGALLENTMTTAQSAVRLLFRIASRPLVLSLWLQIMMSDVRLAMMAAKERLASHLPRISSVRLTNAVADVSACSGGSFNPWARSKA